MEPDPIDFSLLALPDLRRERMVRAVLAQVQEDVAVHVVDRELRAAEGDVGGVCAERQVSRAEVSDDIEGAGAGGERFR